MNFSGEEIDAILLSIKVAIFCSLISLPISILIGYFLARKNFWGKSIIEGIVHLPMVMPPVATGYLLLLLLGRNGFLGNFLNEKLNISIAFSFSAAVIAAVVVSFPLAIRSVRVAIEMVDTAYEEAARTLGYSKLKTFFKITFPLAIPGILGGFILTFARSLGEFGATITFAGNIAGETETLPLRIYNSMQTPGEENIALRLVAISAIISFFAIVGSEIINKRYKNKLKTSK